MPAKLLLVFVLAHVLLSASAQLTSQQSTEKFRDIQNLWKGSKSILNPNVLARNTTAEPRRVGQKTETCGFDEFDWASHGCTSPTAVSKLTNFALEGSDVANNGKVWTLDSTSISIPAGSSKFIELGDWRANTLRVTMSSVDPNIRIYVWGQYALDAGSWVWVMQEDVEEYFVTPDGNPQSFWVNSASNGRWRVYISYWGTQGTTGNFDLSSLKAELLCLDPTEDTPVTLPFDITKKSCISKCFDGEHNLPEGYCQPYRGPVEEGLVMALQSNELNPGMYNWQPSGTQEISSLDGKLLWFGAGIVADVLTLEAQELTGGLDGYLMVAEVTLESVIVHKKLIAPFGTQTFHTQNGGFWMISFANWDSITHEFDLSFLSGTLKCAGNRPFEGPFPYPEDHPFRMILGATEYTQCEAALSENVCAYNKIGLNPWMRWNVFSLGAADFRTADVQGRIAAVGDLTIRSGAQIHTLQEPTFPHRLDGVCRADRPSNLPVRL